MSSLKSSICDYCQQPFYSKPSLNQRCCSKRCMGLAKRRPLLERLMEKLTRTDDPEACWEWSGRRDSRGYGRIHVSDQPDQPVKCREQLTHRTMWVLTHGPIPDGIEVCHRCDNPPCGNPAHLFLGTHRENMQDSIEKGRHSNPPLLVKQGEDYSSAKLTDDAVRAIRASPDRIVEIAARFHISPALASMIRSRKRWKHVT